MKSKPCNSHKVHLLPVIYLISLCNLADDFSSGWIDRRKGFPTHSFLPFIVNKQLKHKTPFRETST